MLSAGSCIDWLREDVGLIATSADTDSLAASVTDSGDVWFVPAFFGIGTPVWDFGARGAFFGITRGTGRAEMARAVLEGIAHRGCDLIEAAETDTGAAIDSVARRRRDVGQRHVPPGPRRFVGAPGRGCPGDRVHDTRCCLHGGDGTRDLA